jgi:chromosome segregation ATPase
VESASSLAAAKASCQKVISAAQAEIQDLNKLVSDEKQTVSDLQQSLNTVSADRDSDRKALSAWYHNPFILVGLGVLVGGAGVLYLQSK